MLVLARKQDEEVVIGLPSGEEIVVRVISTSAQKTKLGIDAPERVVVHRREIWDEIQREQGDDQ